jgi:hypothetical protein
MRGTPPLFVIRLAAGDERVPDDQSFEGLLFRERGTGNARAGGLA